MLSANLFSSKFSLITAAFTALAVFHLPMHGQEAPSISVNYVRFTGVPDDWSHHRLIFSDPGTEENAILKGKHQQWLSTVNDPRYVLHQLKRGGNLRGPAANDVAYWRALGAEDAADRAAHGESHSERDKHKPGTGGPGTEGNQIKGDWGMDMGTGAKVGAGQYPAKFSFITTSANCASDTPPDFVVYNTGLANSPAQASIIAFDNLYKGGCTGLVPGIYWSYDTGGTVSTSVVISSDGMQVAFVQSVAGVASLVILKWSAGEGNTGGANAASTPATPAIQTGDAGAYATCRIGGTSCQLSLAFNGSPNDTNSSPFYDYANDVIYVGDDSGRLHKFTGIFLGTPQEVTGTGSGWPVAIGSGKLTSPVFDSGTNNVFVGRGSLTSPNGGSLSRVPVTGGTPVTSVPLSGSSGTGVIDAPIVDSSAAMVYVFVAQDASRSCSNNGQSCLGGVYQLPTNFLSTTVPSEQPVGGNNFGTNGARMYDGTFDNNYFTSTNSSNPTGYIYVCGFGNNSTTPTLWQIPINGNGFQAAIRGPAVSNSTSSICSPVTEFENETDYIFLSVTAGNVTAPLIGCPAGNGCLMSWDVGPLAPNFGPAKATHATALEPGGTSGVIVDNSVPNPAAAPTGTSQVYFTPLSDQTCSGSTPPGIGGGTGGCSTQASQTGLN
jgi:hypothetical protein